MSSTAQPKWRRIAQLGDRNPIDYGGYFIYRDTTGQYPPEAERLEPNGDDDSAGWTVYRFILERCTFVDGVLSDNQFHPEDAAWFATPEAERASRPQDTTYLKNVADAIAANVETVIEQLCSADPIQRAHAYEAIGDYHGWENFDQYPRTYATRAELPRRFKR